MFKIDENTPVHAFDVFEFFGRETERVYSVVGYKKRMPMKVHISCNLIYVDGMYTEFMPDNTLWLVCKSVDTQRVESVCETVRNAMHKIDWLVCWFDESITIGGYNAINNLTSESLEDVEVWGELAKIYKKVGKRWYQH